MISTDPIPFLPEPVESLRARFAGALAEPHDVETDRLGTTIPPGRLRRCVFDFEDGIRLVVSRDLMPGRELLHVSASAVPGSPVYEEIGCGRVAKADFLATVEARFRDISGDEAPLEFDGFAAEKGIPHWFRDLRGGPR